MCLKVEARSIEIDSGKGCSTETRQNISRADMINRLKEKKSSSQYVCLHANQPQSINSRVWVVALESREKEKKGMMITMKDGDDGGGGCVHKNDV